MKRKITRALTFAMAAGALTLTSCITVYGGMEKQSNDQLRLMKANCSPYGCIDGRELICDVDATGNLSCVDLGAGYVDHNTVPPLAR
ncbi:MAG: hypothetical protein KDK23_14520 [Leptospiraceae bacterium]|nr:hypothetical protein [Leptospiraceae bacterium]